MYEPSLKVSVTPSAIVTAEDNVTTKPVLLITVTVPVIPVPVTV